MPKRTLQFNSFEDIVEWLKANNFKNWHYHYDRCGAAHVWYTRSVMATLKAGTNPFGMRIFTVTNDKPETYAFNHHISEDFDPIFYERFHRWVRFASKLAKKSKKEIATETNITGIQNEICYSGI